MNVSVVRRWGLVVGVAALLAVAAVAAPRSSLGIDPVEPVLEDRPRLPEFSPEPPPTPSAQQSTAAARDPVTLPDWVVTVVAVLSVAIAVAVVGLLVYAFIRDTARRRAGRRRPTRRPDERSPASAAEEVVAAVDASLVELSDLDGDPRRAVIGCWVRLEQAAAAAGTPRQVGDTPTDLVGRLLTAHQVSGGVLAALAHLYREARYGTHTVDEQMRAQALSALHRLRGELTAGAST